MAMNYRIYVDTGSQFVEMPVPSAMNYGLQDISSSNAGRTEDTVMQKDRLGKAPKITLTYNNRDTALVSTALGLVKAEYFNILYQDLENGGVYTYGEFYRGDVSMDVYNGALDLWSTCKFSLIKRSGANGRAVLDTRQSRAYDDDTYVGVSVPSAIGTSNQVQISVSNRSGQIREVTKDTGISNYYHIRFNNFGTSNPLPLGDIGTVIFKNGSNILVVDISCQ